MISRSKLAMMIVIPAAILVAGCAADTGTPTNEVVNKEAAVQKQAGQGGIKAARGGGLVEEPIPAPPGVKTGPMAPGTK